ncbi:MAG: CusA/CzcA family heavy metal efflux RND transporter [Bryobacteraceae bacterium]
MLEKLIDFALDNRWMVMVGIVALAAYGLVALFDLPVDAFPDLTNNQVVVITECPAMSAGEVELLVTYPLESALMGLPRKLEIRSISKLGLSMVTVVFEDDVNTYFARQVINERLQEIRSRLPDTVTTSLGPVATAFGEVYQYTVEGAPSAMEGKTLHEWTVKNQLRALTGVNEVNTWGGETRQYQVIVNPAALLRYKLTVRDLFERIRDNNENFGGGFIEHSSEQYNVRGLGRVSGVEDLRDIVVLARAGTPVLLKDVAEVKIGPMPRQGAVTRDGKGEAVSGMTIMLKGENGKRVIERVKDKLASMHLPEGVKIIPFYDQSTVIDGTIATVQRNLIEGGLLVVLVLVVFLGNVRAAVIVAAVIPLSMLAGFIGMRYFGISANLMSLGAIDFGMIVDGAVVMMENAARQLHGPRAGVWDPVSRIREAAHEVARPILFGVAIIIAVYLPIFLLEGLEGRMFRPMAITVCSALVGSLGLALFGVPAIAAVAVRKPVKEHGEHWFEGLRAGYERLLRGVIRARMAVVALALAVVAVALGSLAYIGTEFMPRLDEGSILIESRKLPGIALSDSVSISTRVEKILMQAPEIAGIVTKIGRPDLATEAMGIHQGDIYVLLKPLDQWKRFSNKEQLIEDIDRRLAGVPGVAFNFTQPMAMRLDEVVSGVKADLAVKIFGEDSAVLQQEAERVLRVLTSVPGAADEQMEIVSGVAEVTVKADRAALARYGMNVSDLREVMEMVVGGIEVSQLIEGQRRFDIVMRLPETSRENLESIRNLPLTAPGGERIRLGQVARVELQRGPDVITRENGQRRIVVQSNVRGRDLGSFVAEVRRRVDAEVKLPPGYSMEFGGQFENQDRAMKRLGLVLPVTGAIIFGILFATFHSLRQALLIILNVPFALVGGVAMLWLRGLNLNLSASIGFIALFGVAVLNGIVLVSAINRLREGGQEMAEAVVEGAGTRLRPVLMTALVASLGFVPMALATSTGAEVQRPLASVVIGGLATSTLLTLFVLPAVYPWFSRASR